MVIPMGVPGGSDCVVCRRYLLETLGTLLHGKRASVELIVHVIACLAEDFLPFVNPNDSGPILVIVAREISCAVPVRHVVADRHWW
jgi:hypothetical protein